MSGYVIASLMVLALGAGAIGGFIAARAEHWDLFRRIVTIDGYLRANAAREGKKTQKEAPLVTLPLPLENMSELDILREAEARGMLHTQRPRRSGE